MEYLFLLLGAGWEALRDYLAAHVATCLVPAFFIAGAIGVFVGQASILRYFGPQAKKVLSYGVASVSGSVLAVCSCTVLPLFAGIYKRGAGLGPAVTFLFSGPAINVLAIIYSARLLGLDIGAARAVGAVVFSIIIGLIMAFIYRRGEKAQNPATLVLPVEERGRSEWKALAYFVVLVGILVFGASHHWVTAGIFLVALGVMLSRWFEPEEIRTWLESTWHFVRLIIPWLLLGVFIAGIVRVVIPQQVVTQWLGGNSLRSNFIASVFGALMYFATLTEVPIVKALSELGMGKGPALALLLAGPSLSLPNMLVIRSIMGTQKTLIYIALVVSLATLVGMVFGWIG